MTVLSVHDCQLRFGDRTILDQVDLHLHSGEVLGLIGPNGAGKSTLLRVLAGLQIPDHGTAQILGEPADKIPADTRARALSYLPQSGPIAWSMSVEALVMLGRLPHRAAFRAPGADDQMAVERAMTACDVMAFRHRPVNQLSGGERARVLLARALATEAEILLADEPIAGLDPQHQLAVMDTLQHLAHDRRNGVIIVLHDLTMAARYCDRLLLLSDGRVIADGSPTDVLTPQNLEQVYGIRAHHDLPDGRPIIVPLSRTGGPP